MNSAPAEKIITHVNALEVEGLRREKYIPEKV